MGFWVNWSKDLKLRGGSLKQGEDGARESGSKKNDHEKWTLITSRKKDMPMA